MSRRFGWDLTKFLSNQNSSVNQWSVWSRLKRYLPLLTIFLFKKKKLPEIVIPTAVLYLFCARYYDGWQFKEFDISHMKAPEKGGSSALYNFISFITSSASSEVKAGSYELDAFKSSFIPWPSLPSFWDFSDQDPFFYVHMHPIFIRYWGSQIPPTSVCAFYTARVTSQIDVNFPLTTSLRSIIKGKRQHECGEAYIKHTGDIYTNCFCWTAFPTLLPEHALLCHQPEPSHYSHKLGHLETRNGAMSSFTRRSTSINTFFQLVKAAQGCCLQVILACLY